MPESGKELASQLTISRFENAVSARPCYLMAEVLFELYLRERAKNATPKKVLLDLDSTDDPTHGDQEGSYYHGYYEQHIYHPLLIFDGESGQLVTAVLRAGNTHASHGALSILKRIVGRLRETWGEDVEIEIIRTDAGFAVPQIYDYCEQEAIGYTIGLISNPRLEEIAQDLLEQAKRVSEEREGEKVRLLSSASYQAGSWEHSRRVIYKAEVLEKGQNTRFVVTSRSDGAEELYEWYIRRGEAEGWIKDFKRALKADRLSCHRFFANQFRLLLHAAAYWLLDALRRKLIEAGVRRMQLNTLRLMLVKIGGRVRQLLTKVRLHLASGHPGQRLWYALSPAHPELAHE